MRTFQRGVGVAVNRGLRRGLLKAKRLALTRYMQRKNTNARIDPPNPPPGPLAIRRGNLARTVTVIEPVWNGRQSVGGMSMGSAAFPYGAIHEYGGWAGRGLRSYIPARPVLMPSLRDPDTDLEGEVRAEISKWGLATLGPLWSAA